MMKLTRVRRQETRRGRGSPIVPERDGAVWELQTIGVVLEEWDMLYSLLS